MRNWLGRTRPARVLASTAAAATLLVPALVLVAGPAARVSAQENSTELRIRAMEAQLRALQRKVFPGDTKFFAAEIAPGTPSAAAPAASASGTPSGDLAARLDSVEAQIKRLTAQSEETANRLAQLEVKVNGAAPAPTATPAAVAGQPAAVASPAPAPTLTPSPTPTAAPTPAANANLSAMTGGASAPKPKPTAAAPSAQRLAAVRAIVKPQTSDAGDDEYSYGFRLWEAKFYPEAEQQLKLMIDRYPRHARISFARNLLGRAYLDDGKPRDAATWFLQNYQASKTGERASDSLLYLAESMRLLKDTTRACIALGEFTTNYPTEAAGRLKAQYDATRSGLKCN